MKKVFNDKPLNEITLRRFEKPSDENLKELCRKFLISTGLLQTGDGRDIISEIFFNFIVSAKNKEYLPINLIIKQFKEFDGGTPNNLRRHLLRLKEHGLIERTDYGYRLPEFMDLKDLFKKEIIKELIEPSVNRIIEYCEKIDEINNYSE
jgi:DNA-binding transcriptional ArsR family regulator